MKGDHHLLAVTTTKDDITGEVRPLFAFPVNVCKATEEADVKFEIAAPSGAPRAQVYVDTATDERVEDADCPRGVRIGDEFRAIPAEAIDEIKKATKVETMVALGQLPLADFRSRYGDRATGTYYLQSPVKGGSPKAYRLVYESLREVKKGGKVVRPALALVTKRTARSLQKLCAIYADDEQGCLVLVQLRFANQLRKPDEQVLAPLTAQIEEKQIDTARQVIEKLGDGAVALDSEHDAAVPLKQQLVDDALAGKPVVAPPTPIAETAATDNLEALLEASLEAVS